MKVTFYATIEYGLGDYDQIPHSWEVCEETMALIEKAKAEKQDFSESEELEDLYHEVFEALFEKEKERYDEMCNEEALENGTPDDEILPFESFSFYVTF